MPTIPAEGAYTAVELDVIDHEPPNLFPLGQDTLYGQVRKMFADYLQAMSDDLADWYNNLDPRTVDANDIVEWEQLMGVPTNAGALTLAQRRSSVLARLRYGAFTRTARRSIVESFLTASFGPAVTFTLAGIPFDAGGIPLYSGASSLTDLYTITEQIENFSYTVNVDPSVGIDEPGLLRELLRFTPAGINVTVTHNPVAPPPTGGTFDSGTFDSGTFDG